MARLAGCDQLRGDHLRLVDRDGETDTDVAICAVGGDRRVDTDDLAGGIDERTAGVARVDGGIGLDRVENRRDAGRVTERAGGLAVTGGNRPVERGHDACGDRSLQAERGTERYHRVA